jgi:hypothetical protein
MLSQGNARSESFDTERQTGLANAVETVSIPREPVNKPMSKLFCSGFCFEMENNTSL